MVSKALTYLFTLLFCVNLFSQADFAYSIRLEPFSIEGLAGLHSYAYGQLDGKWIFIGGRLDGIHSRQTATAFPADQHNTDIRVIDPLSGEIWTASINSLATELKEQLQSANMQFYQDGNQLLFIGGYAYSGSEADHITFPYLTTINLPGLIEDIINNSDISEHFKQIKDDIFAVSGGNLGKIGDEYYLIGGHRFDGRYHSGNHPTFLQTYTDGILKFTLKEEEKDVSILNYSQISDPVNLHRRDYNLLPQIYPNGDFGYTIFSGVFQINQDLPFLYPVDITAAGHQPISGFNQYLSNYHSAHIALFDQNDMAMHNLFFGGISQYYYVGQTRIQDPDVPFVKTISRVSRSADGTLEEVRLPLEMPDYFGASAELIPNENLPEIAPGIVDLAAIQDQEFLLGYIYGGIQSKTRNPFYFNDTQATSAATTIFKVYLSREETTPASEAVLPGYHHFDISVSPNPTRGNAFQIIANAPETGDVDIFLTDIQGRLLLNQQREGLQAGETQIRIKMEEEMKGMTFLTVILNGKYAASRKVVFE